MPFTGSLHSSFGCHFDGLQFLGKFGFNLLNSGQTGLKFLRKRFNEPRAPLRDADRFFHIAQSVFDNETVSLLTEQESNARLVVFVPQLVVHS